MHKCQVSHFPIKGIAVTTLSSTGASCKKTKTKQQSNYRNPAHLKQDLAPCGRAVIRRTPHEGALRFS